jgi:hypothetical protein
MPSKWARVKAAEFLALDLTMREVESVADAIDAARVEGLEEAAKIAASHADHGDAVGDMRQDVCASSIAADIRARIKEVKG